MKLKYRKSSSSAPFSQTQNLLRPIIPLSLGRYKKSLRFEALIDSGADFCIFPTGLAKRLGINLVRSEKIYFSSATGNIVIGGIATVYIGIGQEVIKTKVVFADLPGNRGILGQYGFFDKFVVRFDLVKKEIELDPKKSSIKKR